jgi:hypothetical protein
MAVNVDGMNFIISHELDNGILFELQFLTAFRYDWHETAFMGSCGFKVMCSGGDIYIYIYIM